MGKQASSEWTPMKNLPLYTYRNVVAIDHHQFIIIFQKTGTIYKYDCLNRKLDELVQLDHKLTYTYISCAYHERSNTIYISNYQKGASFHTIFTYNLRTKQCQIIQGTLKCGEARILGTIIDDKYHMISETSNNNMVDPLFNELTNTEAHYFVLDLNTIKYKQNDGDDVDGRFDKLEQEVRSVTFKGNHRLGMIYSELKEAIYLFGNTQNFEGGATPIIIYDGINKLTPTELIVDKRPKFPSLLKMTGENVVSCNNGQHVLFFNIYSYFKKSWNTIFILDLKQNVSRASKIKCPFKKEDKTKPLNIDIVIMTYSISSLIFGFIHKYSDKHFSNDIIMLINKMGGREYVHLLCRMDNDHTKHWRIDVQTILGDD